MNSILQRPTAEGSSQAAGSFPVVKDLHSSIKVSIVSSDWIRSKMSFSVLLSELPSMLLVFSGILALQMSLEAGFNYSQYGSQQAL